MKIIAVDNFVRGSASDILIAENLSIHWGKIITKILNDRYSGDNSPVYFQCVDDDYKLYEFEP